LLADKNVEVSGSPAVPYVPPEENLLHSTARGKHDER